MGRIVLIALALIVAGFAAADPYARARQQMLAEIRNMAATADVPGHRRFDEAVLGAIREVPRHLFVPAEVRERAYANRPLPIGHDQTISQPYIVALMTNVLKPRPEDVILEVGTGSGYQAAVLAKLVRHVYSIEIVGPLARQSSERLRHLGYGNVTVRHGDGYAGWPEHAPFDGVIVTAGAPHIPKPLVEQLKPGGRMVIPVGPAWRDQTLMVVEKQPDGRTRTRSLGPVLFVPLTGTAQKK